MNECTHIGSSGLYGESGRPPAACPGIVQGGQKGLGPDLSPGCPILSSATKEGVEEGGCLGLGQASFVYFKNRIKTSNLGCERKFQDIEEGPTPEGLKGLQVSSHISPHSPGSGAGAQGQH